uniref:Auxin efflux carrier component n=1 Tax=Aegilops tauschii subsp. strangulata TaxID=200361 RepID=A0A453RMM2_AEGTS
MAPLYFALGLGYGSVRWWRFFTAEQCGAINTLGVCFSMPFFTFDFVVRADPYAMNYRVIAADAVTKLLAVLAAAVWARCAKAKAGAYSWSITGFSLGAYNNTLVVGVPLLDAMYGKWAQDLIVQIAVVQAIVWFPLLLLAFELRKAWVVGGGRRRPSAARRASVAQRRRGGPGRGSGATHRWKEDPAVVDGEHRGDEAGEKPQRVRQRPRSRLGVHRLQVAHRHAGHRDGLAAGHVQDRHRDVHVQHGVVHGAAGENCGVRRGPGGAGDGAALRRGPTRGARRSRSRRVRPPRRRATLRHHTGSTTAINCLLRLRKGVWPPRGCT